VGLAGHLPAFVGSLASAWGFLWLMAPLGMLLLPGPVRLRVAVAGGLLAAGGLVSCVFANFPQRMFGTLMPVMVIGAARLYHELLPHRRVLAAALGGLSLVQAAIGIPTVLAPWAYASHLPRMAIYAVGSVLAVWAFAAVRQAPAVARPGRAAPMVRSP